MINSQLAAHRDGLLHFLHGRTCRPSGASTASAPSRAWSGCPSRPSATGRSGTASSSRAGARAGTGSTRAPTSSASGSWRRSSSRARAGRGAPPARGAAAGGTRLTEPDGTDAPRLLVLLAERDPMAAALCDHLLRTEGYDVERALSAADARAKAGRARPRPRDRRAADLRRGRAPARRGARGLGATVPRRLARRRARAGARRRGGTRSSRSRSSRSAFVSAVKDLLRRSALVRTRAGQPA